MDLQKFKSRKDVSKALAEKGIDTKNWSEEKWLTLNKGQAEIHMMALAEAMWDAYQESTPKQLMSGEWHIPFRDNIDKNNVAATLQSFNNNMFVYNDDTINQAILEISTAMCARVSYTVVGEKEKLINYKKDMELHDTLVTSGHMSPTEHCAQAMNEHEYYKGINGTVTNYTKTNVKMISSLCNSDSEIFGWSGNFKGFTQYRKLIESNYALRKIYQRNKSV